MDTIEIILIVFSSILILALGGAVYYIVDLRNVIRTGSTPVPKEPSQLLAAVGSFFSRFMVYLPATILSFGFLSDILAQEYNMSSGSLVGIAGLLINAALGWIISRPERLRQQAEAVASNVGNPFTGGASLEEVCGIPGLEFLNGYLPSSILLTSTILMYYLNGIWANNPGKSILVSSFTVLFIGLQTYFVYSKCSTTFSAMKILLTVPVGLALGTVGYWINTAIFPSSKPGVIGPSSSSYGATPPPPGVGTCSAPNDQDQFVCEAYKNGQLVTSTIVE